MHESDIKQFLRKFDLFTAKSNGNHLLSIKTKAIKVGKFKEDTGCRLFLLKLLIALLCCKYMQMCGELVYQQWLILGVRRHRMSYALKLRQGTLSQYQVTRTIYDESEVLLILLYL